MPGRSTRATTTSSRVVLTSAYTPSAWAIQKLAIKGMANNRIRTHELTLAFTSKASRIWGMAGCHR